MDTQIIPWHFFILPIDHFLSFHKTIPVIYLQLFFTLARYYVLYLIYIINLSFRPRYNMPFIFYVFSDPFFLYLIIVFHHSIIHYLFQFTAFMIESPLTLNPFNLE